MIGGGEGNQETTTLKINVEVEPTSNKTLEIELKSFDPMSAVDTSGELEPVTPNLPDLNKSTGTDSHEIQASSLTRLGRLWAKKMSTDEVIKTV